MSKKNDHYGPLSLSRFVSTASQRRRALIFCLLITGIALAVLPAARHQGIEVQAFMPVFISAVLFLDVITAYMLFNQFRVARTPGLAILAGTYLFSGLITIPHIMSFPGVFSEHGLMNATPQTSIWLWVFWHGGYPLGLLMYLGAEHYLGHWKLARKHVVATIAALCLFVPAVVLLLTRVALQADELLPTIIRQGDYTLLMTTGVGVVLFALNLVTCFMLFYYHRGHNRLQLWLCMATLAALLDVMLTLYGGSRYSIGWYYARINTLFTASTLLGSLIYELNHLYYTLSESEQRYKSLFKHNADAVWSLDMQGNFVSANPVFEKMIGYTVQELNNGSVWLTGETEREMVRYHFAKAVAGEAQNYEVPLHHRNGDRVYLNITNVPIIVDDEVVGVYGLGKDITEKKQSEETIYHLAYHDALTGLPNRRLFKEKLNHALAHVDCCQQLNADHAACEQHDHLAVMFLDLDRFKIINDTLGHDVGDLLLQAVTERLLECADEQALVARMGGDEFTLLLPNVCRADETSDMARGILKAMQAPFSVSGHELHITTSIGVALYPNDGTDVETLMKHADTAMYRAKEQGKNNYCFYSQINNVNSVHRLLLEADLRKALERSELVVYYQPQLDMSTGQVIGMEALVRWVHPERGLVSPGQFIPLAEETGLIVPMGEQVLRMACQQNKAWQDAGFPPLRVAVNLSTQQFQQQNLVALVREVLAETDLAPQWLELEITESIAMHNLDYVVATLKELIDLGIEISMDDFGTGYSSLSYLKTLPIHRIKIDQSFVRDISVDKDDAAIVTAIIAMARSLKLDVIAEGVETEQQSAFLREHGCTEMQGYLFAPPLPAEKFEAFIRDQLKQQMQA